MLPASTVLPSGLPGVQQAFEIGSGRVCFDALMTVFLSRPDRVGISVGDLGPVEYGLVRFGVNEWRGAAWGAWMEKLR